MIVQKMQVSWPVPVYILVYFKYSNVKCGKNCCYNNNKKRVKRFLSHNSNVSISDCYICALFLILSEFSFNSDNVMFCLATGY